MPESNKNYSLLEELRDSERRTDVRHDHANSRLQLSAVRDVYSVTISPLSRLMLDFNYSAMQAGRIVRSILSSKHVLDADIIYWNFSQFLWTHKVHYKLLQRKLQNFDDSGLLSGWSFVPWSFVRTPSRSQRVAVRSAKKNLPRTVTTPQTVGLFARFGNVFASPGMQLFNLPQPGHATAYTLHNLQYDRNAKWSRTLSS